ncbi:hypothetical protein MOQ72_08615 [Saccharopolyspora sp. K220]|uniref:hypothetical protein n=1 Tax=Saccharopolyspora soli TaxID=2926618 RepID=UPI001F57544D|nr:hypothetical protein [Saccharopolyspora soli]MCI2417484.1 hypothetical protein [Saccharopolyspora soli]
MLQQVFDDIEVQRWDVPLAHLPDTDALALFLRGRGLPDGRAQLAARRLTTPITVTKRGMLAWARKGSR